MWNWTSWKSAPATVVVPFRMTSIVVPRFSNSTSWVGMLMTGLAGARVMESSGYVSCNQYTSQLLSILTKIDW